VGLAAFRSAFREVTDWGALLAAATIATLPVVGVFLLTQRTVGSGMLDGSTRD
jgi:ABC-type glycerol-3-phosphate transport system permease component